MRLVPTPFFREEFGEFPLYEDSFPPLLVYSLCESRLLACFQPFFSSLSEIFRGTSVGSVKIQSSAFRSLHLEAQSSSVASASFTPTGEIDKLFFQFFF